MAVSNIISYMKSLKDAGVSEEQAAIHAYTLAEFMENNLASKEDLKNTEQRLDLKIELVEQKMEAKIETMRTDLSARISTIDTKLDWLIRLIGLISVVFAAINFFHLYKI